MAALASVVLVAGACGGGSSLPAAAGDSGSGEVSSSQTQAVDDAVETLSDDIAITSTAESSDIGEAAEAGDTLVQVLDALGNNYAFTSDVTTESGDRIVVDGTRVGDGIQYSVVAGGAAVEVITVAGETWILEEGSVDWVAAGQTSISDPLGPLASPVEVRFGPSGAGDLQAFYAAGALGLDGEALIEVLIAFDADSISFTSTTDSVSLATRLLRADGLAQILAPVQ